MTATPPPVSSAVARSVGSLLVVVTLVFFGLLSGVAHADPAHALPAPSTAARSTWSSVVVSDSRLALERNGNVQPFDFTGINAYQLASDWAVNVGCGWGGWTPSSLRSFFAALGPDRIVRTWAFQSEATSRHTGARDWTALDQLIAAADAENVHLILTLGNQDGTCDDQHWKDLAWYSGGYRQVENASGQTPQPYSTWVDQIVSRYAGNPAIAMWEPVNEPQPADCPGQMTGKGSACWGLRTCPSDAAAAVGLRGFFDAEGGEIHRLDPGALVSDGALGVGNCGDVTQHDFATVVASPGLDVAGYHDYSGVSAQPPGLAARVVTAAAHGKATMMGEAGIFGCASAADQAAAFTAKIQVAWTLGVSAYLPWRYENDNGHPVCSDAINFDSPTMAVVADLAHPLLLPKRHGPDRQ